MAYCRYIHGVERKIEFFMCESLMTTSELTDALKKTNTFFQKNELVELWSTRYA